MRSYNKKPKKYDYSEGSSTADFAKTLGKVSPKLYYQTQDAIKNGSDISLLSNHKASQNKEQSNIIKGAEIREWGLDINSLLVNEKVPPAQECSVEFHARNIL